MAYQSPTPGNVVLDIARGKINNSAEVNIQGSGSATTSYVTVFPLGTPALVSYIGSTASTVKISSSSASDTSAGVGARTVLVSGIAQNGTVLSETVTLNGQTAVVTTNSYININGLSVLTVGSTATSVGTIYAGTGTVTAGVPATVYNLILATLNTSTSAFYTVPVQVDPTQPQNLYIRSVTMSGLAVGTGNVNIIAYNTAGVRRTLLFFKYPAPAGYLTWVLDSPLVVLPGETVEVQQKGGTSLDTTILLSGILY